MDWRILYSASAHGSIIRSCHIMRGTTEFQCVLYASTSWFDPLNFVEGSRYRRRSIAVWRLGSWRSVSYRLSLTRSGKGSSRTRVRHPVRPGQPVAIEAEGPPYRGKPTGRPWLYESSAFSFKVETSMDGARLWAIDG